MKTQTYNLQNMLNDLSPPILDSKIILPEVIIRKKGFLYWIDSEGNIVESSSSMTNIKFLDRLSNKLIDWDRRLIAWGEKSEAKRERYYANK